MHKVYITIRRSLPYLSLLSSFTSVPSKRVTSIRDSLGSVKESGHGESKFFYRKPNKVFYIWTNMGQETVEGILIGSTLQHPGSVADRISADTNLLIHFIPKTVDRRP